MLEDRFFAPGISSRPGIEQHMPSAAQEQSMHSSSSNRERHSENLFSGENPAIQTSAAPSNQDLDAPEFGSPDENGQDVVFTIVDDPKNETVYKGAGSYPATRAETAIRAVEEAFPPLRFELRFEKDLTALHVRARVRTSVDNDAFLVVLSNALGSTGTRLAPVVGELSRTSFETSARAATSENSKGDS
jgi:hypothetical protein